MVLHEMWCVANLRIKDIKVQGDSAAITFHNPESHIHFMHPWPSPMVTTDGHNSAFYLTNAKTLLDQPGEWYLDTKEERLYYMPRQGEDMRTAEVEVPALETLLRVEGTPDRPVTDVTLSGITFRHATWLRPSVMGHAPLQAGMYMTEAYKIKPQISRSNGDHKLDNQGWVGRPAAAVAVDAATDMTFSGCSFEHCASTALDCHTFISGGAVRRCSFSDIGGTAILAGSFAESPREVHRPYTHLAALCDHLTINRNVIEEATEEDWGCVGIGCGYVRYVHITGNTVKGVNYSGICVGWGWTPEDTGMRNNLICDNSVTDYARQLYDAGGIYTLSNQPGSAITDNVIGRPGPAPYATNDRGFCIYLDARTDGYVIDRNLCEPLFGDNHPGPNVRWGMNGRLDDAGPLKR
jgi:hypothetical protein